MILLFIRAALSGSTITAAGGGGFVGRIAPHMAGKLVGSGFESVLPVSVLLGGAIDMLVDLVGRSFFQPLDIPVGVFTWAVLHGVDLLFTAGSVSIVHSYRIPLADLV
ncbi:MULTISPECIES: iron chelate uptake ABC transporter family permease subunit [Paenibacillus]|uniref:iron chelate uptake ABC transporter family permease subunit n=1 Tax=Paenibacillus TaxID=44249 RepID=UPI0022B8DBE4|nr:iron chelate uptake ABC transporter family permease subunit [Paenibacillus caseinilyticus]MCZ8521794.1 iron chelate uptake ABC transporter family permease subunit [Paenibacillus caseinilyticus]